MIAHLIAPALALLGLVAAGTAPGSLTPGPRHARPAPMPTPEPVPPPWLPPTLPPVAALPRAHAPRLAARRITQAEAVKRYFELADLPVATYLQSIGWEVTCPVSA